MTTIIVAPSYEMGYSAVLKWNLPLHGDDDGYTCVLYKNSDYMKIRSLLRFRAGIDLFILVGWPDEDCRELRSWLRQKQYIPYDECLYGNKCYCEDKGVIG